MILNGGKEIADDFPEKIRLGTFGKHLIPSPADTTS
jgi:hypothetical protein